MKTVLLCGYRPSADPEKDPLGLERNASGQTLIERRLNELSQLGAAPICVLAGAFADEQLRFCPRLASAELVFDNGAQKVSLASNLVVALETIKGEACFVLPVEVPCPSGDDWRRLAEHAERVDLPAQTSLLQLCDEQGAPWHFGFPLLVTRYGNLKIQRLPNLTSLVDTRLNYHQVGVASSLKAN